KQQVPPAPARVGAALIGPWLIHCAAAAPRGAVDRCSTLTRLVSSGCAKISDAVLSVLTVGGAGRRLTKARGILLYVCYRHLSSAASGEETIGSAGSSRNCQTYADVRRAHPGGGYGRRAVRAEDENSRRRDIPRRRNDDRTAGLGFDRHSLSGC